MKHQMLSSPHARWAIPLLLGVSTFIFSCIFFTLATDAIVYSTLGYLPTGGFSEGMELGQEMTSQSPAFGLLSFAALCLIPLLTLAGAVGGYLYVNAYQRGHSDN